jgi:hypothetical protein
VPILVDTTRADCPATNNDWSTLVTVMQARLHHRKHRRRLNSRVERYHHDAGPEVSQGIHGIQGQSAPRTTSFSRHLPLATGSVETASNSTQAPAAGRNNQTTKTRPIAVSCHRQLYPRYCGDCLRCNDTKHWPLKENRDLEPQKRILKQSTSKRSHMSRSAGSTHMSAINTCPWCRTRCGSSEMPQFAKWLSVVESDCSERTPTNAVRTGLRSE